MLHRNEAAPTRARADAAENCGTKATLGPAGEEVKGQVISLDPSAIRAAVQGRAEAYRAAEPKQEAKPRAFRLLPLEELLAEPAPMDSVIRDRLTAACLALLFGQSEGMKTFVALDLGLCSASGLPWHGHPVPHPGPVVYIAGEGFHGLARRVQAWLVEHGLTGRPIPFFVASEGVEFLDAGSVERATAAVADMAEQHGAPRLVVVDTLARCFGPGDENSTQDMGRFVAALDRLRLRFNCTVLVVHHSGLQEKERARGASALRAALDLEYRMDVRDEIRVLTCTKAKDFERPPDLAFEPVVVETGWTDPETGDPITSVVLRQVDTPGRREKPLTGARRIALEALAACCEAEGRAHIGDWREAAYKRGITPSEDSSAKRKAFSRAVSMLLESGHVETEDDFYWPAGQGDNAGQTGHVPPMSRNVPGQAGHTSIRGVPCPALGPDGEDTE